MNIKSKVANNKLYILLQL